MDLPLSFRFGVHFLAGGVAPNPIDFRFSRVSGLGGTIATSPLHEGGLNLQTQQLPTRAEPANLTLERGVVVGSPLAVEFNVAFSLFEFVASNVIVSVLDDESNPAASWLCIGAFPVSWKVADLDAASGEVLIETMELAYARMQSLRV